jgi:hypothetical protein
LKGKKSASEKRQERINRISKELLQRFEKKSDKKELHKKRKPFRLKERTRIAEREMIAYDLETTNIEAGTPQVKYITAFNKSLDFSYASPVSDLPRLLFILQNHFLIDDFARCRFVAWNANNFDVYFIAAALLGSNDYILRPYMTKGKKIRGLKVIDKENEKLSWEFLDGMAMTGIQKPLKSFLKVFAPDYQKLTDNINFEHEEFDPNNKAHCDYAMRDSEGLYYGLLKAEGIIKEHFNMTLQPTVGNLGIKIFQANIPDDITVWALPMKVQKIVRDEVMRGGYCHCVRKYHGAVWKYDINQAYAAAMREAWLPCGNVQQIQRKQVNPYAPCAIYQINASHPTNFVPFYWKNSEQEAVFSNTDIKGSWVTSIELSQLVKEKWQIEVLDGYFWNDQFKMTKYVNKLEALRNAGEGGSKGAQGEMIKAVGNNSYGKTVEQLEGLELLMAVECPAGYSHYQDDDDLFQHIWYKFNEPSVREYHQPQIGAFITAHVRMVLRRAIMLNPKAWLYADTDGIMFSEPVQLDISQTIYGKWKVEAEGEIFRLITKKVYANEDASEKHAKGVNINRLTNEDFINWYNGKPPVQTQVQRANFVNAMIGFDMFYERTKVGQKM